MTMGGLTRAVTTGLIAAAMGGQSFGITREKETFMSRTTLQRDSTMKRTAIKVLQVSAAYFAISSASAPSLGVHHGPGSHSPMTANRFAAGAWPMLAIPLPAPKPRKRGRHADDPPHWLTVAANDEKV